MLCRFVRIRRTPQSSFYYNRYSFWLYSLEGIYQSTVIFFIGYAVRLLSCPSIILDCRTSRRVHTLALVKMLEFSFKIRIVVNFAMYDNVGVSGLDR